MQRVGYRAATHVIVTIEVGCVANRVRIVKRLVANPADDQGDLTFVTSIAKSGGFCTPYTVNALLDIICDRCPLCSALGALVCRKRFFGE